ncbi:MAG: hypothetical protein KC493_16975 [Bacteriovoracaceae bacterium]|nr:hypothetical protein [Bacteriovoracaceae bacterium]
MSDEPKGIACGARIRKKISNYCSNTPLKNGRCRLHGGLSTGPRTKEGLERSKKANFKHGEFSRAKKREKILFNWMQREIKALIEEENFKSALILLSNFEKGFSELEKCKKDEKKYKESEKDGQFE